MLCWELTRAGGCSDRTVAVNQSPLRPLLALPGIRGGSAVQETDYDDHGLFFNFMPNGYTRMLKLNTDRLNWAR